MAGRPRSGGIAGGVFGVPYDGTTRFRPAPLRCQRRSGDEQWAGNYCPSSDLDLRTCAPFRDLGAVGRPFGAPEPVVGAVGQARGAVLALGLKGALMRVGRALDVSAARYGGSRGPPPGSGAGAIRCPHADLRTGWARLKPQRLRMRPLLELSPPVASCCSRIAAARGDPECATSGKRPLVGTAGLLCSAASAGRLGRPGRPCVRRPLYYVDLGLFDLPFCRDRTPPDPAPFLGPLQPTPAMLYHDLPNPDVNCLDSP